MEIPEWQDVSHQHDAREVVNLKAIAAMPYAPEYDALRSYATGRREHRLWGPMPAPVARIANRRLWLKADIDEWLTCPLPAWRRSKNDVARWIANGRPRTLPAAGGDGATLAADHGRSPTAP